MDLPKTGLESETGEWPEGVNVFYSDKASPDCLAFIAWLQKNEPNGLDYFTQSHFTYTDGHREPLEPDHVIFHITYATSPSRVIRKKIITGSDGSTVH